VTITIHRLLDHSGAGKTRRWTAPRTHLDGQWMTPQDQEEKLTVAVQRLQSKVDTFLTRKETIKASRSGYGLVPAQRIDGKGRYNTPSGLVSG
jgi:hypothetical protein